MARIRIDLPDHFTFTTEIPVRITDINFGGHVGNDALLAIIHEARVQFLKHHGFEELRMAGVGLLMSDVGIEFKTELFYGETVKVWVKAAEFSKVAFEIYYKLEKQADSKNRIVAIAKTAMVCYHYDQKKITSIPEEVRLKLSEE